MARVHPLEKWLRDTGTTQADLARRVGTHQPRISAFLAGKGGFGAGLAQKISKATGVSLEDLLLNRPKERQARAA